MLHIGRTVPGDARLDVDIVEYASRANAILGIRDSGKTYTATMLAEQMPDAGIPFFAFDPIGRWRFLRSPRKSDPSLHPAAGRGFPIVVMGGAEPDLPLVYKGTASADDPRDQILKTIRAAIRARVSMVIDLYDVGLSKASWRWIVGKAIEIILYENESLGGGLRHVFLEEAAEFVPQRVQPGEGTTYAAVEKLIRMGGNAGVGVTLINQRAEEVNKAVLELCDNLLLHRQRGKNSLMSLRKWLTAVHGDLDPKEITRTLSELPTGECWAWFREGGNPVHVKVATKQSFDPNRRAMSGGGHAAPPMSRVDVTKFIEQMKTAMAGKPPAAPKSNREDPDVKESEARALREENAALKSRVAQLEKRVNRAGEVPTQPPAPTEQPTVVTNFAGDFDALYDAIVKRACHEPTVLKLLTTKPVLDVKVERKVIQIDDNSLQGKCAILIKDGFFNEEASGHAAFLELKRRGATVAKPSVYRALDQITGMGFLTREANGYRAVEGMKVNVVEA